MIIQLAGWLALALGTAGTLLLPRTRHGWLLALAAGALWAIVDIRFAIWSGLVGAIISVIVNARCWFKRVQGAKQSELV